MKSFMNMTVLVKQILHMYNIMISFNLVQIRASVNNFRT